MLLHIKFPLTFNDDLQVVEPFKTLVPDTFKKFKLV